MNNKIKLCNLAVAVSALLLSHATLAAPIIPSDNELQDSLNALTVSGPGIDVINDQSPYSLFTGSASGGAVATYAFEMGVVDSINNQEFGIYSASNPMNKAMIFNGLAGAGDQRLVSFMANGDIKVNGTVVAAGFGGPFGFYFDVLGASTTVGGDNDNSTLDFTWYSDAALNSSGRSQSLIYRGDGLTHLQMPGFAAGVFDPGEFIVAFEALNSPYDANFTDAVVLVESINPVPEPTSLLLTSIGIFSLATVVRRSQIAGK